ncbi:hypothetical protein SBA5_670018 [Candidatus Sulfotelmatomonas gaucii]|uniref:Uncharacterized protein n=1 Tax=Candidatus Sulfuritelmatomonas gaucii TaxID=2043161 RepID=A0A2N9LZF5_9BACT|nr:hypothetical protein SBA5_670018 [Candidatus Sulfotelmatomonas gaucii]
MEGVRTESLFLALWDCLPNQKFSVIFAVSARGVT